jgi:hypothetical protein
MAGIRDVNFGDGHAGVRRDVHATGAWPERADGGRKSGKGRRDEGKSLLGAHLLLRPGKSRRHRPVVPDQKGRRVVDGGL